MLKSQNICSPFRRALVQASARVAKNDALAMRELTKHAGNRVIRDTAAIQSNWLTGRK